MYHWHQTNEQPINNPNIVLFSPFWCQSQTTYTSQEFFDSKLPPKKSLGKLWSRFEKRSNFGILEIQKVHVNKGIPWTTREYVGKSLSASIPISYSPKIVSLLLHLLGNLDTIPFHENLVSSMAIHTHKILHLSNHRETQQQQMYMLCITFSIKTPLT
mmetsp:Transcript_20321/g.28277  ORF Transcript_20321/g.28277 Transcript_20321/m.28277 type:complete len:158 (+) Transcript_20321:684-1157(+)